MLNYYHYFTYGFKKHSDRLLLRIRKEIFDFFVAEFSPKKNDSILDVGVSDDDHPSANYFEKRYPYRENITTCSITYVNLLSEVFQGLTFVQCDGKCLPFRCNSFDYTYSHAVIEHVGSRWNQERFIDELIRVAKKGVMITTPNRYHPFEFHTGLPFIHLLPARVYRYLFRTLGKGMYADEDSLHLIGVKDLQKILNKRSTKIRNITFHYVHWLKIPSNIIVIIRK